jgi:hypothetical protein
VTVVDNPAGCWIQAIADNRCYGEKFQQRESSPAMLSEPLPVGMSDHNHFRFNFPISASCRHQEFVIAIEI